MKPNPGQVACNVSLTTEISEIQDGDFAARWTMTGLYSEDHAEKLAHWVYELIAKNIKQAMIDCPPDGAEFAAMEHTGDGGGKVN